MLALMTLALVLTILSATGVWSPLPFLNGLVNNLVSLSDPDPKWTVRVGGKPDIAAVMDPARVVVVGSRGFVDAYRVQDGKQAWHMTVNWVYPAANVVVAQQRAANPDADPSPDRGYAVIDPANGSVRWSEAEATAVWIYAADLVDLVCPDDSRCVLRRRSHDTGAFVWQVSLPGNLRVALRGPNPHLAGARDPAGWFGAAAAGTAPSMPTVMALPAGDKVLLVDTFAGRLLREATVPDREMRVAFVGDRLLFVRAERAEAGCRYLVEAFDVESGNSAWKEAGFDLDTARGAGCEQREDPMGVGGRLVVTGTDAKPMLVEADNAARTWTGVPGERVLATDGRLVAIMAADRKTVRLVDAAAPDARALWSGAGGMDPQAAVTSAWVLILDRDARKLTVLQRSSMRPALTIETTSDVIGYGSTGIVITSGRSIGYFPLS